MHTYIVSEVWVCYTIDSVHGSTYHYTTIAGQWLNSLIFHDDIKCVTISGQMILSVGLQLELYHVMITHFAQTILGGIKSFLT